MSPDHSQTFLFNPKGSQFPSLYLESEPLVISQAVHFVCHGAANVRLSCGGFRCMVLEIQIQQSDLPATAGNIPTCYAIIIAANWVS